jgi:iron complex outermembrane recepter protein
VYAFTQDYTNYSRGYFADYYQCYGPTTTAPAKCYSPSATLTDTERATHQSHELRLSMPGDWRLRAVAEAFWEKFEIYDQANWEYRSLPACTAADNVGCLSKSFQRRIRRLVIPMYVIRASRT